MKTLLTSIFSILIFTSFSQRVELQWGEPKTINPPEGEFLVLNLEGAEYSSSDYYLPKITKNITGSKIDYIEIVEAIYENCNAFEAKLIDPRFQNSDISFYVNSFVSGTEYINQISLIPIKFDGVNGLAQKLISLEYNIVFKENLNPSPKIKTTKSSSGSALASGSWFKYQVGSSGIYKLTYSELKSNGVNVDNLNPQTLKIYNNGGGMLPEANSEFRFEDLNEIPITVVGEHDGRFNFGDYILFYGESTHKTVYDDAAKLFHHEYNIYDNYSYYFITYDGNPGKRITNKTLPSTFDGTVNQFDEFKFYESDLENVINSGREWYGDNYTFVNPRSYGFNIPGLVSSSNITVTSSMMGMIPGATGYFRSKINGVSLGTQTIIGATTSNYGIKGNEDVSNFTINSSALLNPTSLNLQYTWDNSNNQTGQGYTNFIEVNYKRKLSTSGSQIIFSSIESLNNSNTKYLLSTINQSMIIWDVQNPIEPKNINYNYSNGTISFIDSSNVIMKYACSGINNYKTPTFSKRIINQNLHSTTGTYDLLIITPSSLLNQAQMYGNFKSTVGISNKVVSLESIYNEFSCGAQDVLGIRDFIKYVYEVGASELKYVLLFGDASFDYKNINGQNQAVVPIYEAYQSLNNITTYSSDDYFGFLDNDEGNWTEDNSDNHFLNIGIGRFPVKTPIEAQIVINKLINYSSSSAHLGNWRNNIAFVADDGDGALHMSQADDLSKIVLAADSNYNIKKLFLDSYEQITTPGGQRSPDFDYAFTNATNTGNLIVNYTGHGSERQWAVEELLTQAKIQTMTNETRLPLYVTATCEFGRYDYPGEVSGAENLFLLPNGGAVGLVTTTRPVYSSSNLALNTEFYNFVFTPKNDSTMRTLGDIMIGTKNNSLKGVFNRGFSLLGDPSLTLSYPKKNIAITKINGSTLNPISDTIKALQTVTLEGEVQYYSGKTINNYNGKLYIKVLDKASTVTTLGDEKDGNTGDPIQLEYQEQKSVLFDGVSTIKNGEFSVTFVVPKDIAYNFAPGKISMYAMSNSGTQDANGYENKIIIGGSATNVAIDNSPPEVQLFMDDESFIDGSIVDVNSFFIAKIKDYNGINTAGTGIGHEITATLDNNDKIVLNSFYQSKLDSYQEGSIKYLFEDLAPGRHTITFKIWDTHNNSSTSSISFNVSQELDAYNYPNPFTSQTRFVIDQPRSGESGKVSIHILNIKGDEETVLESIFDGNSETNEGIIWNGKKPSGEELAPGVYFYRVILRYSSDGAILSKLDRLLKIE